MLCRCILSLLRKSCFCFTNEITRWSYNASECKHMTKDSTDKMAIVSKIKPAKSTSCVPRDRWHEWKVCPIVQHGFLLDKKLNSTLIKSCGKPLSKTSCKCQIDDDNQSLITLKCWIEPEEPKWEPKDDPEKMMMPLTWTCISKHP